MKTHWSTMFDPWSLIETHILVIVLLGGVGVLLTLRWMSSWGRDDAQTSLRDENPLPARISDIFQIAYLRSGTKETIRVATLSLIERGLLKINGYKLQAVSSSFPADWHPLEKAILKKFAVETPVDTLYQDPDINKACQDYHTTLSRWGLLLDSKTLIYQKQLNWVGVLFIWAIVALHCIAVFSRNLPPNSPLISLAFVLSLFFGTQQQLRWCTPTSAEPSKWRTQMGERILWDFKKFVRQNKNLPIKRYGELALIAASFGIHALTKSEFPEKEALFPMDIPWYYHYPAGH